MQNEVEESIQECRNAEEKAKKAITDVSSLVPCSYYFSSTVSKDRTAFLKYVTNLIYPKCSTVIWRQLMKLQH